MIRVPPRGTLRRQAWDALVAVGQPLAPDELAAVLGWDRRRARSTLADLVTAGACERDEAGRYLVPREALAAERAEGRRLRAIARASAELRARRAAEAL